MGEQAVRSRVIRWCCLALGLMACAAGVDVQLQSPLTSVARFAGAVTGGDQLIHAVVEVPADAPADLGVGAFVCDRHGRWFQQCRPGILGPGRHELSFAMSADSELLAEPDRAGWSSSASVLTAQAGVFFWSASASRATLHLNDFSVASASAKLPPALPTARNGALHELRLDGMDAEAGVARCVTGERWSLSALPAPFPSNPYDPDEFALDAVFTAPDGRELRVAGFAEQPMALNDRGDREVAQPVGPCHFSVRFRPRLPGSYQVRVEARWNRGHGGGFTAILPPLEVAGQPWDEYVHVDHDDPRFFAVDGHFYWPIGLNLNSTYDTRCRDRLGTKLTPDRGSQVYRARFRRFAAAGGTAVEIWMSSWNLAMEWRGDWPGYFGVGRYNEGNAARLDAILDAAWANGIRINLVINNHGQASPSLDREWKDNPYNKVHGGPFEEPYELFTSPIAAASQERLRRYLIARYADHPAILGWKLWSEVNLTAAGDSQRQKPREGVPPATTEERHNTLKRWHEQAAARWHALDVYGHAVTTHWSGDYHKPERDIVALPGLDFVCIDAYLNQRRAGQGETLASLIYAGTQDPTAGLGGFGKPLLVTEYGATWQAGSKEELNAELASAPWAGMASGNGGCPMLWWFEWVDQQDRWQSYGAIARFMRGEDLRGSDAHATTLTATSPAGALWSCAWARRGRMLGYALDQTWAGEGQGNVRHEQAHVVIGNEVAAGDCQVEWWDAESGALLSSEAISHLGGALTLAPPPFVHHIAFKLIRTTATQ